MNPGFQPNFKNEKDTLITIRKLTNHHLITPTAAMEKKNFGVFLFPWAEGGNLKEFWRKESTRASRDPKLVRWALGQMYGLCDALSDLHGENCRHGDLKPENILLFDAVGYEGGTLRIADVGLAKQHLASTQQRDAHTNTNTGTIRYEPPEFQKPGSWPRRYDVWSLGCVFTEFLIWILYGVDQLDVFNGGSTTVTFWERSGSVDIVRGEVSGWIQRMSIDLKSNNSASETALKDVLDLVISHMLVPDWPGRKESEELRDLLKAIYTRAEIDQGYLVDPTLWGRTSTSAVPGRGPTGASLQPPGTGQTRIAPLSRSDTSPMSHDDAGPLQLTVGVSSDGHMRVPVNPVQEVSALNLLAHNENNSC